MVGPCRSLSVWTTAQTLHWHNLCLSCRAVVWSSLENTKSSPSEQFPRKTVPNRDSVYTFSSMQLNTQRYCTHDTGTQRTHAGHTRHALLAGCFMCACVFVSFRNWQLSVWWKSCVCLWKETPVYISGQQLWALGHSAPTTSGTSAVSLYGRLASRLLLQCCICDIFQCIVWSLDLSKHH